MRARFNHGWHRRGISFLWDPDVLHTLVKPAHVVSIRQFFAMCANWPDDLPACDGAALVVAGVEGCLDVLAHDDAERWIENDLRPAVLSFQDFYEGQAGLMFWLPSGRDRIEMTPAKEQYLWKQGTKAKSATLEFGRLLWAGAEREVERLMNTDDTTESPDGKCWVGLYHPRIS